MRHRTKLSVADEQEELELKIEVKDADDESDDDECGIRVDKKKLLMDLGKVNVIALLFRILI